MQHFSALIYFYMLRSSFDFVILHLQHCIIRSESLHFIVDLRSCAVLLPCFIIIYHYLSLFIMHHCAFPCNFPARLEPLLCLTCFVWPASPTLSAQFGLCPPELASPVESTKKAKSGRRNSAETAHCISLQCPVCP